MTDFAAFRAWIAVSKYGFTCALSSAFATVWSSPWIVVWT